jgi:DNA polymerase-1
MADVGPLREAFEQGEDIHARTAQELFGEVTRDTRSRAKTINFAILYGISRWGLAGRLGTSADEAQAMIDRYFERFPGIQRYIHDTLESVRARGYSETLFGRKTWFPRIASGTRPSGRAANAPRSTRRSRARAPTSSSAPWPAWGRHWSRQGCRG